MLVRSGNVMTIYPAATSIAEMLAQLRTTAAPREIERRDDEPLADREGLGRVSFVLDTNVAIHLRHGDPVVAERVGRLDGAVLLSVVTRVELEGGVYRDAIDAPSRRVRLDAVLSAIPTLAFDEAAAGAYRTIVERAGYSRRKLLGRMIAAQAIVHRATVLTMNPADSADIPVLDVLAWCARAVATANRS